MKIIGCDLHARLQTLAMLDTTTGEVDEQVCSFRVINVRKTLATAGVVRDNALTGQVRTGRVSYNPKFVAADRGLQSRKLSPI